MDESTFCLYNCNRNVKVLRRPNERYAQCNVRQIYPFYGGSVMALEGIFLIARTDFICLRGGTLTNDR